MIGGNGVGFFQGGSAANPVVSITPNAGIYSDPIQVTLSASSQNNPTTIYYTLDGSNPSSSSSVYTAPLTVNASTTVKAIAVDGQGSQSTIASNHYTIGEVETLSIYFEKPSNWSGANIHYWALSPSGGSSTWPGPTMIDEGNSWYRYDFAGASSTNIVFNDNGGSQTTDLFRTSTGWYDQSGTWHDTDPRVTVNQPPTVAVSPNGGIFTEGEQVNVVLTASDDNTPNPSIYYTLDGSDPDNNSILYTGGFSVSQSVTIKAIAYDAEQLSSPIVTAEFVFNPAPDGLTVHFQPDGYDDPEIYFWGVTPSGQTTSWPGVVMTDEGDGWYSYTLDGAECANVIFSNNGASQTQDLSRCSEGWYVDGTWHDTKPESGGGLTIHFKKPAGWGTARMHYWNVTPASVPGTNWPGVQMIDEGNGWWSYTIADASCTNIVFNDNGAAQTTDLSRCGEGWYDNGWSGSARLGNGDLHAEHQNVVHMMGQNFPNPFSEQSNIPIALDKAQKIRLSILTLDGKEVMSVYDGKLTMGHHRIQVDGQELTPGIYLYKLVTSYGTEVRRMVVR